MPGTDNKITPSIYRLSISPVKGEKKKNVKSVTVLPSIGIEGDAHARSSRPVSLLPYESFSKLANSDLKINPGDFAENITTVGLNFGTLVVGTRIALGDGVILEIIQIGKECHNGCVIKQIVGDCIMPREGVFANVIEGGILREGDPAKIL
ncbi:MAG: MOSC domain-containing protein [candidate division Zixibacteria bacterium]